MSLPAISLLDYVGMRADLAVEELLSIGVEPYTFRRTIKDPDFDGYVCAQKPQPGRDRRAGQAVVLYIGTLEENDGFDRTAFVGGYDGKSRPVRNPHAPQPSFHELTTSHGTYAWLTISNATHHMDIAEFSRNVDALRRDPVLHLPYGPAWPPQVLSRIQGIGASYLRSLREPVSVGGDSLTTRVQTSLPLPAAGDKEYYRIEDFDAIVDILRERTGTVGSSPWWWALPFGPVWPPQVASEARSAAKSELLRRHRSPIRYHRRRETPALTVRHPRGSCFTVLRVVRRAARLRYRIGRSR